MPPEKQDAAYLWDRVDSAKAVREFVASATYHEYQNSRMLRGAVERHIEIIDEAAGKVSKSFRDAHPEIPWRRIIGQRHVLAHEYGEIEDELMWKVAVVNVPELIKTLKELLPAIPPIME